jgi:DNA-binding transcriptional LysR family regulator
MASVEAARGNQLVSSILPAALGIALLPEIHARQALASQRLLRVLPAWRAPASIVHVVFPNRRGMAPATRAFIEHVAKHLSAEV